MRYLPLTARAAILSFGLALSLVPAAPALAQAPQTTMQTLLDRIQIEDLITSYYGHLGGGSGFADYYVDDATFDVNGKVYKGKEAIEGAYKELGATSPIPKGTFRMLLSNPQIRGEGRHGGRAVHLDRHPQRQHQGGRPRFIEQGREYDRAGQARRQMAHLEARGDRGLGAPGFLRCDLCAAQGL